MSPSGMKFAPFFSWPCGGGLKINLFGDIGRRPFSYVCMRLLFGTRYVPEMMDNCCVNECLYMDKNDVNPPVSSPFRW